MIALKPALIALSLSLASPAFAFGAFPFLPNMTFPETEQTEIVTKQSGTVATDKIANNNLQHDK